MEQQAQHEQTAKATENPPSPPSVGRIVHFFPYLHDGEARNNGNPGPVAAMITRVWNPTCVNITVFPDFHQPILHTSVQQRTAENAEGVWDWPARV